MPEITQVNELLTWMDAHPLPFIAATNFARRLDPAALRRFVLGLFLGLHCALAARARLDRLLDLRHRLGFRRLLHDGIRCQFPDGCSRELRVDVRIDLGRGGDPGERVGAPVLPVIPIRAS